MIESMIADGRDVATCVYVPVDKADEPWLDYPLTVVYSGDCPPFISHESWSFDTPALAELCVHLNDIARMAWSTLFSEAGVPGHEAMGAANVCMGVMLAAAGYERKDGQAC